EAYSVAGARRWRFETLYPPVAAVALAGGTVFVALFEAPGRICNNVYRASRPGGLPGSPPRLLTASGPPPCAPVLGGGASSPAAAVPLKESPGAVARVSAQVASRVQIGACVAGVLGCAAVAALFHSKWLMPGRSRLTLYIPLVLLGGACLARLQHLAG